MVKSDNKSSEIKVSVILPVYNVEDYISRCIESLKEQTFSELEFIFVDDCSTDCSMDIVEAWAREDDRVRIMRNEKNMGAGTTRNRGIEIVRGEYLSFIDPDDWVIPEFFELLYTAATADGGHDIAKGFRVEVDLDTGNESLEMGRLLNRLLERDLPFYRNFKGDHWTAIYRKSLFDDPGVRYGTSRNSEDTTMQLRLALRTDDMVIEPGAVYYYLCRDGSAANIQNYGRFEEELIGVREKAGSFNELGVSDRNTSEYLSERLTYHFSGYRNAARFGSYLHSQYETYLKELIKTTDTFPDREAVLKLNKRISFLYDNLDLISYGRDGEDSPVRVSVIVPVSNVRDSIALCIERLQRQLLDGIEFIFVDDGSTDGSMEPVEAWAREDDRVRILRNEKTMGSEASRNRGREIARGEYLSFVDPGDWIAPELYELLYSLAVRGGDPDVAKGRYRSADGDTKIPVLIRAEDKAGDGVSHKKGTKTAGEKNREPARRYELDLLKAVAIISMVVCHSVIRFGVYREGYENDFAFFFGDDILGGYLIVAHGFMFAMGFGVAFSTRRDPLSLIRRGIKLFIAGYILNFFRYGIYCLGYGLITGEYPEETLFALCCPNILQFAGLALMATGVFFWLKLRMRYILAIGLVLSVVGSFVPDKSTGVYVLDLILGNFVFITDETSTFPFFSWYIFVAVGILFGKFIRKRKNKDQIYKKVLIVAGCTAAVYLLLTFVFGVWFLSPEQNFYRVGAAEAAGLLSIDLFLLSAFHYLLKKIDVFRFAILIEMSKNITHIYFIHWIIIGFIDVICCYLTGMVFSYPLIYAMGAAILVISFFMARWVRSPRTS